MSRTYWSISPSNRPDGRIEIAALAHNDSMDRYAFNLEYEQAWTLFTNLAGCLQSMADKHIRTAAAGDCATCGNFRMVTVEKNGREVREFCPDCDSRDFVLHFPEWPENEREAKP